MRGLTLVGPVPPPSGGVASHIEDLARAAHATGVRVTVVDTSARGVARRVLLGVAAARLRGDLVHLHTNGHNPGSWRLAALVAALAGERSILTLHSGLLPAFLDGRGRLPAAIAGRYGAVVCVSAAIAEALARAGWRGAATVAPAFSSSGLPLPLPPAGLARLRALHDPLVVCAIAPGREYGVDVLLAGFARLAATHARAGLVVFGPSGRDVELARAAASIGLADRLHQYGDLPRAEALGLLQSCDVFLRPTRADGDAVSVREALALGRRVVASDCAPRPDGTHRFRAGDAADLARAVEAALAEAPPSSATVDHLAPVAALYRRLALAPAPPRASRALYVVGSSADDTHAAALASALGPAAASTPPPSSLATAERIV